jgi:transposase-like protein/Zn ribbon nucleic-acid-binding protein
MEEYPRNEAEFDAMFPTDEACREYAFRLRWPAGYRCPKCQAERGWWLATGRFECAACGHQTSVTAGTIFQDTHYPLQRWFRAMWWITSQKTGASALGLQRVLGLGSYQTAWTWLHKLRRAMVRPGRDRLSGCVEVDETYWGALAEGHPGRGQAEKALIVVAAQEDGRGIGRIRMRRIEDLSANSLHPFVVDSVEPGSVVRTDGWSGYQGLEAKGYTPDVVVRGRRAQAASVLLPRVHRVVSLLKRWLLGTHQGAISHRHLDYYLDEFTFRFNRRKSRHRGLLFYRLGEQAVHVQPVPYAKIVRDGPEAEHNL